MRDISASLKVVSIAVVAALGDGVFDAFDTTNTEIQTTGGAPVDPATPAD